MAPYARRVRAGLALLRWFDPLAGAMGKGRDQKAVELAEFAGIPYTSALAVIRGERWPDTVSEGCLVLEWARLRSALPGVHASRKPCNCEECYGE